MREDGGIDAAAEGERDAWLRSRKLNQLRDGIEHWGAVPFSRKWGLTPFSWRLR
jgi:hypothetical protein